MLAFVVSDDESELVTVDSPGQIRFWDLEGIGGMPKSIRAFGDKGHGDWILAIEMTADRRYLVTGSADGTIRLWRTDDQQDPLAVLIGWADGEFFSYRYDVGWVGSERSTERLLTINGKRVEDLGEALSTLKLLEETEDHDRRILFLLIYLAGIFVVATTISVALVRRMIMVRKARASTEE